MKRVLVLGATSTIASCVARIFAARGARLHLVGRNVGKLEALAAQCRDAGASMVTTLQADFDELDANEARVRDSVDALGGVDIALIAHGDLGDQLASERTFASADAILKTNFTSVVSLLIPLANHMEAAKNGCRSSIGNIDCGHASTPHPRSGSVEIAAGPPRAYPSSLEETASCGDSRSRLANVAGLAGWFRFRSSLTRSSRDLTVNGMEKTCIGVITSVAGERGRPRNYTYGAAKGALNVYLQGLRTRLYASGVTVTTLKLGPVDTPMTRDHGKHALFGKPERVAKDIVRAMHAGTPEAYVPKFWAAIMPVVKNTPEQIFQRLSFLSGR